MAKYNIWSIDAWQDGLGGWDCNNRVRIAEVEMPKAKDLLDKDIINALYEQEIITTEEPERFHIWDMAFDPLIMQITNADTEEPLFEVEEVV